MIRVRLWRSQSGDPVGLEVRGHANRGAYGDDIVCAAVSALVETLDMGLRQVLHQPPVGSVESGSADLVFGQPLSSEARAVVETVAFGLQDLAQSEPDAVTYQERTR